MRGRRILEAGRSGSRRCGPARSRGRTQAGHPGEAGCAEREVKGRECGQRGMPAGRKVPAKCTPGGDMQADTASASARSEAPLSQCGAGRRGRRMACQDARLGRRRECNHGPSPARHQRGADPRAVHYGRHASMAIGMPVRAGGACGGGERREALPGAAVPPAREPENCACRVGRGSRCCGRPSGPARYGRAGSGSAKAAGAHAQGARCRLGEKGGKGPAPAQPRSAGGRPQNVRKDRSEDARGPRRRTCRPR